MSPLPAPSQEQAEITERVSWVPISVLGRQDSVVGRAWTRDQTTLRCAVSEGLCRRVRPLLYRVGYQMGIVISSLPVAISTGLAQWFWVTVLRVGWEVEPPGSAQSHTAHKTLLFSHGPCQQAQRILRHSSFY